MKRIWKFELNNKEVQMPERAEILTLQIQHGKLCVWAMVDPQAKLETRKFEIHGTGDNVPDDSSLYIGTYQERGGNLIWHVFEKAN